MHKEVISKNLSDVKHFLYFNVTIKWQKLSVALAVA